MKNTQEAIAIKNIPLFEKIAEKDLEHLLPCLRSFEKHYEKGESIFLEEQHIRYIGVVLRGSVHMLKDDLWGSRTLVSYAGPGELFGENFAVRKENHSEMTFEAAAPSDVLFLAASNIIHTCPSGCSFHAQIAENMFHLLGEKSVRLMEKIEITSKPSLREKILAYLSMLAQHQNTRYVTSPLDRTQLAQYLCVNRSSMTRELSTMRD